MDIQTFIPPASAEKLKCFSCKNHLSYFPLSLSTNKEIICGRCPVPPGTSFRIEALEIFTQLFKFPCRYKWEGCYEELLPKEVPQHEKNCLFRVVPCIVSKPPCLWNGSLSSLTNHCRTIHSELILEEGEFTIDSNTSHGSQNLLEFDGRFLNFLQKFDCEKQILQCCLYNNQYEEDPVIVSTQLRIKTFKKSLTVDLESTKFEEKTLTEISLQSLEPEDKKEFLCEIFLVLSKKECPIDVEKLNSELLAFLECSRCSNSAKSPVLCRENKGTICSDCVSQHNKSCYYCDRYGIVKLKNFDNITPLLRHSCRFQNKGCTYVSRSDQLGHLCKYTIKDCPVEECPWEGCIKDLPRHGWIDHEEMIKRNSAEILLKEGEELEENMILEFNKSLYYFSLSVDDDGKCKWEIRPFDLFESDFQYEIEVCDGDKRILVKQVVDQEEFKREFVKEKPCYEKWEAGLSSEFSGSQVENFEMKKVIVRVFK